MSAPQASVIYDAPGPKARRRARILSAVSIVLFLVIAVLVVQRLDARGQFEAELWSPLYWPGDEDFAAVWRRIATGVSNTIIAAVLAIAFSLVIGTAITTTRLLAGRVTRMPLVVLVEVLRGSPVVVLIFFSAKLLPELGVNLSQMWYLIIGLTAYNCVVIAEILRAGVAALPRGQREAGLAIGLRRRQVVLLIQLPQAFRLMLPALVSQLVVIVKDTSLSALVLTGPEELLRVGRQLSEFFGNPLQTFTLVAILFIIINSILSWFARFTERRLSRARGGVSMPKPEVVQEAPV